MDWSKISFDWNRARTFLITAQEGSLSAAAKIIGSTQPTISRQISALEEELSVELFQRSSLGLELTPNGKKLLEFVKVMGEVAEGFSQAATLESDSLKGEVCISANEMTSISILAPIISKLSSNNPSLKIELIASNDVSNLNRREADIAIRSFRPTQDNLIARKIREDKYKLYAANSYVNKMGCLAVSKDLSFIGSDNISKFIRILNEQGLNVSKDNFNVSVNNHLVNWELVKQGAGIGVAIEEVGDSEPLVKQVFQEIDLPKTEVWLVANRDLKTSKRVRLVFDYLADALEKEY
jgi:DNA-binding transcriptional LysR family regulator